MKHEKKDLVTAMSIQMRAEVVSFGNGMIRGELHSRYLDTPYEFFDFLSMVYKMEGIFDAKRFPEKFVSPRTFGGKNDVGTAFIFGSGAGDVMKDAIEQIKRQGNNGVKCTFEISVKFRQNATWQGQIHWLEAKQKQDFRSVLEMLKLIDGALAVV
jgi:hypothetical protein